MQTCVLSLNFPSYKIYLILKESKLKNKKTKNKEVSDVINVKLC